MFGSRRTTSRSERRGIRRLVPAFNQPHILREFAANRELPWLFRNGH
jgi:hypothetical protein